MGCSTSSVVPLTEAEVGGAGIKVRVNPSTPETARAGPRGYRRAQPLALESSEPPAETLTSDFGSRSFSGGTQPPPPPTAFDVPVGREGPSKRHPPRRLRRPEDPRPQGGRPLTREAIDARQRQAEARRKDVLGQRARSALGSSRGRKTEIESDRQKMA